MQIAVLGSSTHTEAMAEWVRTDAAGRFNLVLLDTPAVLADGLPPPGWQGVMVMDRDPATRLAGALAMLGTGLPVFVDKPLALTEAQAFQVLRAERDGGGRLASFSALRWRPEVAELAAFTQRVPDELLSVQASGPVDPSNPWGGIAFYASHVVELALQLAPGRVTERECRRRGAEIECRFRTTVPVTLTLQAPDAPFEASVTTSSGRLARQVVLPDDYYRPTCERIADFLAGGSALTGPDDHLGAARVLEAACHL